MGRIKKLGYLHTWIVIKANSRVCPHLIPILILILILILVLSEFTNLEFQLRTELSHILLNALISSIIQRQSKQNDLNKLFSFFKESFSSFLLA